ncbi:MAG TPA: hypothetical protein DCF68_10760 [Cyanothece sp. UBA12306]|nr:hypothetical protein [Cyanothece sp. UBA12306]
MSKFIDNFNNQTLEKQELILKDLAKVLAKDQQFERLCKLLTDFNYLQLKLDRLGVAELIDDYDLGQNHDSWQELRLIQKSLYMSGDILAQDTTQLAKELTQLLATYQHLSHIKRFLKTTKQFLKTTKQYQDQPWLCLLSPTISLPLAQPLIRTLTGHSDWVYSVTVTPDGKKVISGSRDKTVKIWDLVTGNCIATFTAEASITCVAVAPDGVSIVAGDSSGKVHFLQLIGGQRV